MKNAWASSTRHGTLMMVHHPAVLWAMHIIEEMVPVPNVSSSAEKEATVGDYLYCSPYIATSCAESKKMLSSMADAVGVDLQVAFTWLAHVWRIMQDGLPDLCHSS